VFEAISKEAGYASITFIKVDVDENSETSEQAGVTCMPTFQLYKGGSKVGTLEGANEGALRALLDRHK
jgi:thioredoxin 1